MIRRVTKADSNQIVEIYNHYILNSITTFEENVISAKEMSERIVSTLKDDLPWLVVEEDGEVLGYAYANKWKTRSSYRFSIESTVYLDHNFQSKGWGSILYTELLKDLRSKDVHMVIGVISLPNVSSVALHEKLGFEKVAHFKEVGRKFERWIDVGFWQLKLGS